MDIQSAFDTALERLRRGEATLDQCVADHPEHSPELRRLLILALDLEALDPRPLEQAAVDRGARLIDEELQRFKARGSGRPTTSNVWDKLSSMLPRFLPARVAGMVSAFAVAIIAYGGVTLAAVNSGPESALFGYRLSLEVLRVGLAPTEDKAFLYLDTAEQRLREIEASVDAGDAGAAERASTPYQEVVRKGVDVLGAVTTGSAQGNERVAQAADNYRDRLADHDARIEKLVRPESPRDIARTQEVEKKIAEVRDAVHAGIIDVSSGA